MKYYFFKTYSDKGRNRLRPLPGQNIEGESTLVDITLNVQASRTIRSLYPLGTIFCSNSLINSGTFYTAGDLYPMVSPDQILQPEHTPTPDMRKSLDSYMGVSTDTTFDTGDGPPTAPIVTEEKVKKTLLVKMQSNPELVPPTIKKNGFYVETDNWYLLLRNILNQVNTLLIGPTGTGKCLGKDTPVMMADGSIRKVQDVRTGDFLMGPDSKPRKVLSTCRGVEELFRIHPKNGEPWVCNRSHILSLVRTNDKTSLANTVVNVSVNDYLQKSKTFKHLHKQYRVPVEFPERKIHIDPYFLGLWLGDGRTDSLTISTPDEPVVMYLKEYAQSLGMKLSKYPEPSKADSYGLVKKERTNKRSKLQRLMDKYSLLNNKHIPQEFLRNSRSNRLKLFAGLMDSDGHNGGNYYEYCTVLDSLKDDVLYLGRSLGYAASTSIKTVDGTNYWRIFFTGSFEDVPVRIARKTCSPRKQIKNVLRTGFTVESLGLGHYYGFEISGDKLFLLGDCTVTHNTELILMACERVGIPCSVYDMGSMYDPVAGLLGVHRLQEGGKSVFDYAKFTEDISKPGVVLLDELSRAPVTTNNILFPCLDSRRSLPVEIAGGQDLRRVEVHPDCCFVATANIGSEYTGTMSMDKALVNRFFPVELDYLSEADETQLLVTRSGIPKDVAATITKVAAEIRSINRRQELSSGVSTRETLMVAELIADGWTPLKAMELVFLPLFEGTNAEGERGIVRKIFITR